MSDHSDHILRHYGRMAPPRADTYAISPSRHSDVTPRGPRRGGEGLVLPSLTPEARTLLEKWAAAQAPPPPPAPPVEPKESTYYRLRRLHRSEE